MWPRVERLSWIKLSDEFLSKHNILWGKAVWYKRNNMKFVSLRTNSSIYRGNRINFLIKLKMQKMKISNSAKRIVAHRIVVCWELIKRLFACLLCSNFYSTSIKNSRYTTKWKELVVVFSSSNFIVPFTTFKTKKIIIQQSPNIHLIERRKGKYPDYNERVNQRKIFFLVLYFPSVTQFHYITYLESTAAKISFVSLKHTCKNRIRFNSPDVVVTVWCMLSICLGSKNLWFYWSDVTFSLIGKFLWTIRKDSPYNIRLFWIGKYGKILGCHPMSWCLSRKSFFWFQVNGKKWKNEKMKGISIVFVNR